MDYLSQFTEDHITCSIFDMLNAEGQYADEYPDLDEPWDEMLAEQEFEQADLGCFGGDEDW